jgi:hypothetical protein
VPPILPPQNGFLFLDKARFAESFAADVDPEKAAFMAICPLGCGTELDRASRAGHVIVALEVPFQCLAVCVLGVRSHRQVDPVAK